MAATSHRILVPVDQTGLLRVKQQEDAAAKATELLQRDLQKHHVFFNKRGFHNHIVHHVLALYGTGASPEDLVKAYDANASYQVAARPPDPSIVQELKRGWSSDCPHLGVGDRYPDFLEFFQGEIDEKGWEEVVREFVFKGDERSHTMMERLYGGLLHPMIQLMYGIEWNAPGIVAEGLAQAAAHRNHLGAMLTDIEQKITSSSSSSSSSAATIPELFESIRRDENLARSARYDDESRERGVFARAGGEMLAVLSRVRVRPEEVDEKTAEMMQAIAYVVASTAFCNPRHEPRWDFFYMHHLNASLFFVSVNKLPFVTPAQKARLLEWKIRLDLIQYVAQGSPPLNFPAVQSQVLPPPSHAGAKTNDADDTVVPPPPPPRSPRDLFARYHRIVDDGHAIKAVRGLLVAQELSAPYAGERWVRFVDEEAWLKAHYLLLRGTESGAPRWVFGVGYEEAWKDVPLSK